MAQVIIMMRIMPESVETDLTVIEHAAENKISAFGGEVHKREIQPVAFGLKSINLTFIMDEAKGSTDSLETEISELPHVGGVEITDVRRALG